MTINNNSVVNNQTLRNDNVTGFNSSDPPTVSVIYLEKSGSWANANGGVGVDQDTNIYIHFSEAMDNSSITAITSGSTCSGTVQLSRDGFSNCLPMSSSPAVSNNNKIFTFDPSSDLAGGYTYKIRVTTGVKDGSGNTMSSQEETDIGFTVSGK